jgi:hypothetical protein
VFSPCKIKVNAVPGFFSAKFTSLNLKPIQMKITSFNVFRMLLCVFGITSFVSCAKENSDDVNQDRIYAEYELYYDKNTDKTYASAIFRFGSATGTQLELTAPSDVKFNNDVIPFDPVFSYYLKEYSGRITSGTFTFTDTDGLIFTNPVSSMRTIAFPAMDTIHSSNSYTLTWVGDSVVANERAELWMDGPLQNNAELFIQYTLNTNNFVLGANRLQALGVGTTACTLERIWETTATGVTGAGGKVRFKYRALNASVQVVP